MKFKPKTNQEIIDLAAGINSAGNDKKNAKFSMLIARIKYALKDIVAPIDEAAEAPEVINDLAREKNELFIKYATAAEDGKTKVPDDKWPEFMAEIEDMKKKYQQVEDDYGVQMKSHRKLLKEQPKDENDKDLVINLVEIPESLIPNTLTGNQIEAIMPVIKFKG